MSDQEVEELREKILSERKGKRRGYSRELREGLQAFVERKCNEGAKIKDVCDELGLNKSTVHGWRAVRHEREVPAAKLRRVKVIAEQGSQKSPVTMHGPCGIRLEGLSLGEVAELWRKLSC